MTRLLFAALASLGLTSCNAMKSQIVPVGKDTYQLIMPAAMFSPQAATNRRALRMAGDYCSALDKRMVPDASVDSGAYGWSAGQDNFIFTCLDRTESPDTRAALIAKPAE
jgi:hypothetical protein